MRGEKRSSLLVLLLMLAMPASGQNFTVSTTVLETTSAEITNFSVVTGSPVDFLFTIHNVGNTNISVFPEITVCDPDNNIVVQLIYNTQVSMLAGSLKDLKLSWNTNNHGNFTAKLVVFYDNNSKSATVSRAFVLPSAYTPAGGGSTGGYYAVTPKPIPASAVTPAPTEAQVQIPPRQPTPQQFQPIVTATVVAASQGLLPGILAGILGFALLKGEGTASSFWILVIGVVLLYGLKSKRYI
jgi:hypothetical protein